METTEREISFHTKDDWTIYGTLHLPVSASSERPAPGVLLLHGAGHDRDAFASFVYPGMAEILASQGVAALRIDWRGRGQSMGQWEYHSFTEEQRESIYLDVKAAFNFMAAQPEIDPHRLAVFAEDVSAEWAVKGSRGDPRVKALAILSGRLTDRTFNRFIAPLHQLPMLVAASREDRDGYALMGALREVFEGPESDFLEYEDLGIGTAMFTAWRYKYPDEKGVGFLAKQGVDTNKIGLVPRDPGEEKPIEEVICNWLIARLTSFGLVKEISFRTEDDWTIYGNLCLPGDLKEGERVPGIVLLHSGLSDRYVFHNLERLFVKGRMAVLNIDWRGRGKSREKGGYHTLSREERDRAHLDAKAAINVLANQPEVKARKMAILGTYLSSKFAMNAALGDSRIGALVMLSGYIPTGQERKEMAGAHFPILFIASRGLGPVAKAMIDLHKLTKDRGSEIIIYDGGALGYQLFEIDKELEQKIVNWVKKRLWRSGRR
jgi:dipeptidyl aminopeptidase/acylaminoacyl peptidase